MTIISYIIETLIGRIIYLSPNWLNFWFSWSICPDILQIVYSCTFFENYTLKKENERKVERNRKKWDRKKKKTTSISLFGSCIDSSGVILDTSYKCIWNKIRKKINWKWNTECYKNN